MQGAIVLAVDPMVQATDYLVWVTCALAVITAVAVLTSIWIARGDRRAATRERVALHASERLGALEALRMELLLNLDLTRNKEVPKENESILQADITTNFVPFQREALSLALRYLSGLPSTVRETIQKASLQISRYNTIATSRGPTEIRWIVQALEDARCPLEQAIESLNEYLSEQSKEGKVSH